MASEYMNTIARAVADMEDDCGADVLIHRITVFRRKVIKYIKDMHEKSHELLKAYCNLTDEDIAGTC